uniref:Uncharacterized protein n=1 Tax=Anguilla anguilla TaxID=7936 RepID=A0A0E9TVR6_ANGAN
MGNRTSWMSLGLTIVRHGRKVAQEYPHIRIIEPCKV